MADILVVDDEIDVGAMIELLLQCEGHCVRVARDGLSGLALLQERHPDVVVLDIEMPLLDGPGMAYRMFMKDCGLERIPILLISGVVDLERFAHDLGTPYALAKPFSATALLALLHRALAERTAPNPPAV